MIGEETGVLFEDIADVFVRDDRIYVTDRGASSIQAFDWETGQLVASAGRKGEGPGEFRFVDWVGDCGGDTIFVSDFGLDRVSVFSLDLEHIRTFALDYPRLAAIHCVGPNGFFGVTRNDDPLLYFGRAIPMEPFRATLDLLLLAPDGSLRRELGQFPGADQTRVARSDGLGYSILPIAWGLGPIFDSSPQGFVLGTGDAWSLVRYDVEGNVLDTLALDESRLAVSRSHVNEYVRRRIAIGRRDPATLRRYYAEYPFPSHFPAYSDVVASDDGFTWVEHFSEPYSEFDPHWKVFAPDGTLAATADLPKGFELMWVGETHAAGVARDDLGVQSVEVRPIRR